MEFLLVYAGIAVVTTICLVIVIATIGAVWANVAKIQAAAEFAIALDDNASSTRNATSWHPSENV